MDLMVGQRSSLPLQELTYCFSVRDAHVPDMRTQDGFLDVVALGCVLEFTTALDRTRYHARFDSSSQEASAARTRENQARTWFRVLMKVFSSRYSVHLEGQLVHPSGIWHSVLVGFAAALVNSITEKAEDLVFEPGVSPEAVRNAVRDHLQQDHPHLLAPFEQRLMRKPKDIMNLTWTGPAFDVIRKTATFNAITRVLGIAEDGRYIGVHPGIHTAAPTLNRYYDRIWPGEELDDDNVEE